MHSPILIALSSSPIPAERLRRDMRFRECDYERRVPPSPRTLTRTRTRLSLHSCAHYPRENPPLIPEAPLKVALKELRETEIWLKVVQKAKMIRPASKLVPLIKETDELIAILFTSVETAKKRKER